MNPLSPAVSRLAAIGIFLVLLIAVLLYAVLPVWNYYADKVAEVKFQHDRIQHIEYLISNEDKLNAQLEQIEREKSDGNLFLVGNKPAIASANLREFVTDTVKKSGAQIISSQEYKAEAIPETTAIGLQLHVSGEVKELMELVHALESSRPVIFIDELSIRSSSSRVKSARRRGSNTASEEKNSLDIDMNIVGYLAGSTPEESEGVNVNGS